jgi:hypothetical protein
VPPGGRRSISDTLRHMAYVEHYIAEKLVLDREPKTIVPGALFAREEYPTFDDVIRLMHEVHATTILAYEQLTPADLKREIPAFRRMLTIERCCGASCRKKRTTAVRFTSCCACRNPAAAAYRLIRPA